MSEVTEAQLDEIEALFVQNAHGLTSGDGTITLHGVSPSTIYFADRPKREVGHMSSRTFVDLWGDGENSFEIDPPNAALTFLEHEGRTLEDVVVTLTAPRLEGNDLTYAVDVLDGVLPEKAGATALFIDPFGRPLSPVSVAGMRRRERRRL